MSVLVPTMRGEVELLAAEGPTVCALGCGVRGGGMALARVTTDGKTSLIPFCGNCLAGALVDRIDKNTGGARG